MQHIVFGVILIGLGAIGVLSPRASWYMSTGWRFRDAEPSEAALAMARLGGVVGVAIGIYLLFAG